MDTTLATALVSTSGAVVVAVAGLAANTFWIRHSLSGISHRLDRMEDRMNTQFDTINGKLSALDLEVAKLMDRPK